MAQDATTKHHWLRNINNRFIFSHNYGGWKAKIQQGWILGKNLLTDSCFLLCPHKAERGRFRERGLPILIRLGPTLRPHLTLITSSGPYLQRYSNLNIWGSVQFSSVTQSCLTLRDPMNRSTWDLPIHHQLPEFNQTHVHRVGDAIQPSHPLSSPSPPVPNPSQHQSLFLWVNSSYEVAKVLEFQL